MSGDAYYGFDLAQRKTLAALGVVPSDDGTSIAELQAALTAAQTSIANLTAWATALATKLNADAGVTDTDYDTDPQA